MARGSWAGRAAPARWFSADRRTLGGASGRFDEHCDPTILRWPQLLNEAEGLAGSGSIFVATGLDAPGDGFDEIAERLARKRDLSIALIADRFEIDPPRGGYPFRTNQGDAGWLRIARKLPAGRRLTRLRRLGVDFVQIDAALGPRKWRARWSASMADAAHLLDGLRPLHLASGRDHAAPVLAMASLGCAAALSAPSLSGHG